MIRLPGTLEAFFWEKSRAARYWLRRQRASFFAWRQRRAAQRHTPEEARVEITPSPLASLAPPLLTADSAPAAPAEYSLAYTLFRAPGGAGQDDHEQELADTESLLLGIAGWEGPQGPPLIVELATAPLAGVSDSPGALWTRPQRVFAAAPPRASPVIATVLAWPGAADPDFGQELNYPLAKRRGQIWLHPDASGPIALTAATNLDERLAAWPPLNGPPTVLFLLPFLAVGGAERLLFDLLRSWQGRYRAVIVTLEPHAAHLGQTVDTARRLTPWVFPLGDWWPRECHFAALCHLVRRLAVSTLCSWNGTIFFYDQVAALRRRFPGLRIAAQLYHHQGGFFARNGPEALAAIDLHCAVNQAIAQALREELGVRQGIELVHHGVEIPNLPDEDAQRDEKRARRAELGLTQEGIVVGTFARLHPQKRPLDVLALARRFASQGSGDPSQTFHFLWIGGGPLEQDLRRELARNPTPNFIWRELVPDARPYYAAVDLCLLTSAYEGLPIFLLDGLARGLPCVATAVGEIPFLLSAGGGVVAEPGDLASLEAGLRGFVDPQRRASEGQRGRANVRQHFALEVFARRYREILLPGAPDV